jgi:hypothetical protein
MAYTIWFFGLVLSGLWIAEKILGEASELLPLGGDSSTQIAIVLLSGFSVVSFISILEEKNGRKK